jgi:hypothetical protein
MTAALSRACTLRDAPMIAAIYAVTMLSALLVVLTPWSASAECAWVLWRWTTGTGLTNTTWQPVSATAVQPACESAMSREIAEASLLPPAKFTVTPRAKGFITSWVEPNGVSAIQTTDLLCLPDTVDPRASKVSGR